MPQISTDKRTCSLQIKLFINCSPWLVGAASFRAASDIIRHASSPQISWLVMLVFIGLGSHKVYAGFLKTEDSSPVLFIQKGESYYIKYRYKTTKLNLSCWAVSHHYQCWTQLQDHSHHYQFQSEIIIILSLVLYSCLWQLLKPAYLPAFIFLTFLSSPKQGPHRAAFPFLCRYRSFPSVLLSSSTTHPVSAVLLPCLISLPPHPLVYPSSKPVCLHVQFYPILTCPGMAPSLFTTK